MGKRLIGIGALKSLKNKKIRFNLRPFSNSKHVENNNFEVAKDMSFVDLHLDVAKKVDALIAQLDQEQQQPQEWDMTPKGQPDLAPGKILSDIQNNMEG